MRRLIVAIAIVTIPVALIIAVVRTGGVTAAAVTTPSCTTLSGNLSVALVGGCNSGLGAGRIKPTSLTTGSITWRRSVVVHGKSVVEPQGTTAVKKFNLMGATPSRCPKGTSEFHLAGTVSSDTTHKIPVGSKMSADVCWTQATGEALLKGTVLKL